jgi:hypothetical protein
MSKLSDEEMSEASGGALFQRCPQGFFEANFYKQSCSGCHNFSYTGQIGSNNTTMDTEYQVKCDHFGKTTYIKTAP